MILLVLKDKPQYLWYMSDTTWIAQKLVQRFRKELIAMGILKHPIERVSYSYPRYVDEGYRIQSKVLRQLNNLYKEGKVEKEMDYGGEGTGRNILSFVGN